MARDSVSIMTRSRVTLSRKGDGADALWKARCAGSAESSSASPNPDRAPHGPWLTFALAAAMLFAVSLLLKDTSFGGWSSGNCSGRRSSGPGS
jgi:hypothetical protein